MVSVETQEKVAELAQQSFWQTVANAFPEVKTGDFPPDATIKFDDACKEAVRHWLYSNHPDHR